MRTASIPALLSVFLISGVTVTALEGTPSIPELQYLNENVDPCEDFYEFTCGNFKNVHPLPEGSIAWDHFAILQKEIHDVAKEILSLPRYYNEPVALQKAKAFYTSCLNVRAMEGLNNGYKASLEFLNTLHKWPAITIDYDDTEEKLSWNDLADLAAEYGLTFIFSFQVTSSARSNTSNVIYIKRDALNNPIASNINPDSFLTGNEYLGDGKAVKTLPYFDFLKNIAFYLRDRSERFTPNEHVIAELDETIQYMRTIQKNGVMGSETVPTLPSELTAEKLQKWTDDLFGSEFIDWVEYLNRVIKDKNVNITKSTLVMQNTTYIYGLLNLYKMSSVRQLKNYVIARLLTHMAPDSEKFMRDEWETFSKANQYTIYSREDYCVRKTLGYSGNVDFSLAVTHEYQNSYFNKNKLQKAAEMIDDLRNTFLDVLDEAEWMDEESSEAMIEKAIRMNILLGYPEEVVEVASELDNYYKDMKVCTWDHLGNSQRLRAFQLAETLYHIGAEKRRDVWTLSPLEVNAVYNKGYNRIILPVSILNKAFFTGKCNVLDYARIGSIIGHEITHGFDETGKSYDSEGVLSTSWTESTLNAYKEKSDCFKGQYSKYFIEEIQQHVNGNKTLNENLADNGGMRIAYKALQTLKSRKTVDSIADSNYTPEQLLFIGFGTMWCSEQTNKYLENLHLNGSYPPSRYRVIGTVSNMPEFSDAFKCPQGSKMNPTDKCRLW